MTEVGVILGSDSDLPKLRECLETLDRFGVAFEIAISSAHRSPERTLKWAATAPDRGIKVIIAAAGGAAHLPGVVASQTIIPVIGVPIETKISGGLDSLLSIAQMPAGVPVASMAAGKAGGVNAALFAVSILSVSNAVYAQKLAAYRREMAESIAGKNEELGKAGYKKYINKIEA